MVYYRTQRGRRSYSYCHVAGMSGRLMLAVPQASGYTLMPQLLGTNYLQVHCGML